MLTNDEIKTYPSIRFLQSRIGKLFEEELGYLPSFPGHQCDLEWSSNSVIDVIFFGDAAYSLIGSHFWPRGHKFRLWVLNESFKNGLSSCLGFTDKEIAVIPRERLLERKKSILSFPEADEVINFIFAGRMKESKNFTLTAQLVHHLEKHYLGEKTNLYIFTPRSDHKKLKRKFPQLNWITRPKLIGDGGKDWFRLAPKKSILINLSIDPMDDFNVSCAEAQECGWPLILPDRGPYRDIQSNKVIYVPLELLRPGKPGTELKQLEDISLHILSNWAFPTQTKYKKEKLIPPVPVSFEKLKTLLIRLPNHLKNDLRTVPHDENVWDREVFKLWEQL